MTYEERFEYVQKCLYAKLTEHRSQIASIRRGIAKIIPESLLNLITHEELKIWVCGSNEIDINLLRKNTRVFEYSPDD